MQAMATVDEATIRAAIEVGRRSWTQVLLIGTSRARSSLTDLVAYEKDKTKADLLRSMCRELYMTEEEIAARYDLRWSGPYSRSYEEDEEGDMRPVPLDRAEYHGYDWRATPKRSPETIAVYVVPVPIAGNTLTLPALESAFGAVVAAHHGYFPLRLRLGHATYVDYRTRLIDALGWTASGPAHEGAQVRGVPVAIQRRAPEMTLFAVYPLL